MMPLAGERKIQPLVQTNFDEDNPKFSPDGHWLAYNSNETGRSEVYLQAFPGPGEKVQVSTEGGGRPRWAHDGRELFYRNGNKVMAVSVSLSPALKLGTPQLLFEGEYGDYDLSPDGKNFLMIKPQPASPASQINIILNWKEELKRAAAGPAR